MINFPIGRAAYVEKRRARRFRCKAEVSCRVFDPRGENPWPAWVANVSATGICLLVQSRMEPGRIVTLQLLSDVEARFQRLLAEVRHAAICCPNNAWLHGLAFVRHLRDTELRDLI